MDRLLFALTFLAVLGCGLIAGVFFAFSAFVMAALARLPPAHGVAAMQSINIVVINPAFLGVFLGTSVVCATLAITVLVAWRDGAFALLAGSALYLVGTLGVTMACNVPLNNRLAAVAPADAEAAGTWSHYCNVWTLWNHVRTAAAVAAVACFLLAL